MDVCKLPKEKGTEIINSEEVLKAFRTFEHTLKKLKTTRQLWSLLINCQPTFVKKHGERKIKVQPCSIFVSQFIFILFNDDERQAGA